MNREIKFRSWDKIRFRMSYEICDIDFNNKRISYHHDIQENGMCSCSEYDSGDIILEQYTGLKDKNGIDIYEGDIVRFDYSAPITKGDIIPIYYLMQHIENIDDEYNYHISGFYLPCPSNQYEIAGNIHENAELLI